MSAEFVVASAEDFALGQQQTMYPAPVVSVGQVGQQRRQAPHSRTPAGYPYFAEDMQAYAAAAGASAGASALHAPISGLQARSSWDDHPPPPQPHQPRLPREQQQQRERHMYTQLPQHQHQGRFLGQQLMQRSNPTSGCKLFVGGLAYVTTEESMRAYFGQFGDVISTQVIRDPSTGRSRGFGFVTFLDPTGAHLAAQYAQHLIDGRKVEAKPAVPKHGRQQRDGGPQRSYVGRAQLQLQPYGVQQQQLGAPVFNPFGFAHQPGNPVRPSNRDYRGHQQHRNGNGPGYPHDGRRDHSVRGKAQTGGMFRPMGAVIENKIFVGGLNYSTSEQRLVEYFSRFGEVTSTEVIMNRETQRSRGFGFVLFQRSEAATSVLQQRMHVIDGKHVEIKKCHARVNGGGSGVQPVEPKRPQHHDQIQQQPQKLDGVGQNRDLQVEQQLTQQSGIRESRSMDYIVAGMRGLQTRSVDDLSDSHESSGSSSKYSVRSSPVGVPITLLTTDMVSESQSVDNDAGRFREPSVLLPGRPENEEGSLRRWTTGNDGSTVKFTDPFNGAGAQDLFCADFTNNDQTLSKVAQFLNDYSSDSSTAKLSAEEAQAELARIQEQQRELEEKKRRLMAKQRMNAHMPS